SFSVNFVFFFQAEDGIRDRNVTGVQTCALPICDPVGDSVSEMTSDTALVGYINITLNVAALRTDWVQSNLWLWLMTTTLAIIWALFILRKLNWPSKDIAALTEVCDIMLKNPELEQLPAIPQRFKFEELVQIKQAFIT